MLNGRDLLKNNISQVFLREIAQFEIERHIENIVEYGYTVIGDYLKSVEVDEIRACMISLYVENEKNKEYFKSGAPVGFQNLIKNDQMINNLVAYDKVFIDIATTGDHLKILKYFLDDPYYKLVPDEDPNFILAQLNARAANIALPFHVDTRMVTEGFSTWSMQGFLAIGDVGAKNGCLRVIPGSHKSGKFPVEGLADSKKSIDIEMRPGDLVLFSSQLHHGTREYNSMSGAPAWTILLTYRCWWCKQQFSLYELVDREIFSELTNNQKLLLGAASVTSSAINASSSSRIGYDGMWRPANKGGEHE